MIQEQRGGARAFVRSLNILLKFARLYEFGHAKTMQQFETAWKELRGALDDSSGGGVLLGASGTQILLDGVPLGSAAGERSFAHLLTSSGIASIHFSPTLTQPQFARFVRAFPSGNAKPSSLAEQLKTALAGDTSIKVNEIRYVAEDSSVAGIKVAAQLTQKVLGAAGDKFKDFFEDPNKMLQMILAAESMRSSGGGSGMGGPGHGPGAAGPGFGLGSGGGSGGGELGAVVPVGAVALVRQEAALACGIPVWPEEAVVPVVPGQVAELELVVGLVPAARAARVAAEVQELVAARGRALVVRVAAEVQELVAARGRALVVRVVGVALVAVAGPAAAARELALVVLEVEVGAEPEVAVAALRRQVARPSPLENG